jgi:hypothetical protein
MTTREDLLSRSLTLEQMARDTGSEVQARLYRERAAEYRERLNSYTGE